MSSSDVQVQGSNDWSIASKLSTVTAGYYTDSFISCFAQKPVKRSSLIHRGYYVRAKAIHYIFNKFLSQHPKCQIISFGAGFDTSFFMLRQLGHKQCQYVEIDFPDVVANKWQLIKNHPSCSELAAEGTYHLVAADLRNLPSLTKLLFESLSLNPLLPTLLISECAITYMDETSSSKLIEWCADTFLNAVFAVYEQIRPSDGFGRVMQQHFIQLSIPLLSLPIYPNQECQRNRYLHRGWSSCEIYDINEFAHQLVSSDELNRMRKLETFDEYEGFNEKCSHYIILTAAKGICTTPLPPKKQEIKDHLFVPSNLISWQLRESLIQRYGQAGCPSLVDGGMWIVGGFGARPQGHGRLDNLIRVHRDGTIESQLKNKRLARMYHSLHLLEPISRLVIYGGRTHPAMALGDVGFINVKNNEIEWLEGQLENGWPEPRWRHASSIIPPCGIFVGGGCGQQNNLLTDCWVMRVLPVSNIETPSIKWELFVSLPSGRHSATASYWQNLIVISGGLDKSEMASRPQLLVSDTGNSSQQQWIEPEWHGPSPIPRYSHQALVTADNRLILVGGISTCHTSSPGVCVIDLLKWTCVEYKLPIQDIKQPVILASFNAQLDEEEKDGTKILCWGGGSPCFSFGTHLNNVFVELKI
ncbi:tRNA wybutosine-synthesizing protein 4-like isoform X1 [Daphnia carinata]|uniref:tRNA wybutosine-synthesizing protein 4-like isoform X1 n=1 Tax=Daphnia carinata TaxID=120202 RepID=UPI00257F40F4|nr:tRNA wybutosine-synthesizing protein 4-like isoform X1 [Daphnia carinata]